MAKRLGNMSFWDISAVSATFLVSYLWKISAHRCESIYTINSYRNKSYYNLLTDLSFIKDNINYKYSIILPCERRIDAYRVWWL